MIEGFRIDEIIYESEKTKIFRAYREVDNTPVIIKMLNVDYPVPEEIVRFKSEFNIVKDLDMQGVIQADNFEQVGHRYYFVSKDINGESISRSLPPFGNKLKCDLFLPLAIQICQSLEQVHRHNIIHKDINPSNIIWNPQSDQVELIDFGISTQLNRQTQSAVNPEVIEGTIAYMSPEQTGRMNRAMDYRTDFYSLGVTFYKMLVGQKPFVSDDPMEMVYSHIARVPQPPAEINPEIPEMVSAIVMKMMSKMAEDRYQSAYGLKSDLERCLK